LSLLEVLLSNRYKCLDKKFIVSPPKGGNYQINNTIPAILGGDFGDSPFRRLGSLQQNLENPLAQEILAAKFVTGDTINIDWRDEAMTFSKI